MSCLCCIRWSYTPSYSITRGPPLSASLPALPAGPVTASCSEHSCIGWRYMFFQQQAITRSQGLLDLGSHSSHVRACSERQQRLVKDGLCYRPTVRLESPDSNSQQGSTHSTGLSSTWDMKIKRGAPARRPPLNITISWQELDARQPLIIGAIDGLVWMQQQQQ
jgi:hypothetical protein